MKNFGFLFLIIIFFSKVKAQDSNEINASKLVDIIEKADFTKLVKLVSSLNYAILDSSKGENGSLFYYAREPKFHGNVLACSADNKKRITELSFDTFNKEEWLKLKSQLIKIGFKSSGIYKGKADITESEDFEKGQIVVATAIRKDKGQDDYYEFTLIKF